jgi:hypothetical protein
MKVSFKSRISGLQKVAVCVYAFLGSISLHSLAAQYEGYKCTGIDSQSQPVFVLAGGIDEGDQEGELHLWNQEYPIGREFNAFWEFMGEYDYEDFKDSGKVWIINDEFKNGKYSESALLIADNLSNAVLERRNEKIPMTCEASFEGDRFGMFYVDVQRFAKQYEMKGNDNNFIEISSFPATELKADTTLVEIKQTQVVQELKSCAFVAEGAYGNHITKNQQNKISRDFLAQLEKRALAEKTGVKFFKSTKLVSGFGLPVSKETCSIVLSIGDFSALRFNSVAFD